MAYMLERYDKIGCGYANLRLPDERILGYIRRTIDEASSVLNVGAGTGSYEPSDLPTVAVEPSFEMIKQRHNRSDVVQARAEALPFGDGSFDVSLAVLTIHHWSNLSQGLEECARSTRYRVSILTWDPDFTGFWLTQRYLPELLELDRRIFPSIGKILRQLGNARVDVVPIPADCTDGFLGAYWQRPDAYLNDKIRSGMSSFARIENVEESIEHLRRDLHSGLWHRENRHLLSAESIDLGYRMITAEVN